MQTLTEYQYLDTDMMLQGVYDWLFEESGGLLQKVPVREVEGNGVKYNVETTRPGASWLGVDEVIPESAGTYVQRSASITTLIGDIDIANFAIRTNSKQNPELIEAKRKVNGFYHEWFTQLVHGYTTSLQSTKQPKGLNRLIAELETESTTDLDSVNNTQVIAEHATSAALELDSVDTLIDAVEKPTHLMMTKWCRRKLTALARAAGNNLEHDNDALGYPVTLYGSLEVIINEHIGDNFPNNSSSVLNIDTMGRETTRTTDYDNTIMYCLRLKEDGFTIIQAGPMNLKDLGEVQNKDAIRKRVKWYTGFGLFDKFGAACLIGIEPST